MYFLLNHFIKRQDHMFLVHDRYHQYVGIVTLEDALEKAVFWKKQFS